MTKRLNPDPDLESLIQNLNESARTRPEPEVERAAEEAASDAPRGAVRWPLAEPTDEGRQWLTQLLEKTRAADGSDLMLVAGAPPTARVNGSLTPLGGPRLSAGAAEALSAALVPASRRAVAESAGSTDFALSLSGLGRLRCNVHREGNHWAAAVRVLPEHVPDFSDLNLPAELEPLTELEHGLVLVTGPTGSGKSTTLAAMVRRILARRTVHLITIEDPVEYTHAHAGGSVTEHVEIGRDASSFAGALRAALRQDPDVLLVGEMRDPESIAIAITAAETGHLVLSTLHTGDAPQTVHRILDSYAGDQIETVRVQLSISLAGIVSQQLLPRKDGVGRVPAVEIMVATVAVRNLIRQGRIPQLRSQFALERSAGMLDLDRSLAQLVRDGLVDEQIARPRARVLEEFDGLLRLWS